MPKKKKEKLQVTKIKKRQGDPIASIQNIVDKFGNVFMGQFKKTQDNCNYDVLKYIMKIINKERNEKMERMSTKEKVKQVVFY